MLAAGVRSQPKRTMSAELTSPKIVARAAGSLYLFASVCFVVAMMVRSSIIKASDAAGAASNIRSSAFTFRASLAADLVSAAVFLLAGLALYVLLQHVHRLVAAVMVTLVAVQIGVLYLNELNLYPALAIATNARYTRAFGSDASSAMVMLFLDTYRNGLVIAELFFGLWLVPLSYLVLKSGQFPLLVGVLLIVAAVDWIGQFFADLLAPGLPYVAAVGQIGGAGELVFVAWLLIFGIRPRRAAAREPVMVRSLGGE